MNITEFKKEIESLFQKLKFRHDLRGGFDLQLEESEYEQNDIEFLLPTKVKFVGFDRTLEAIDLTKELSFDIDSIERRLTSAIERIDFYKWIYNFAKEDSYEIEFRGQTVSLFTEDRKEIEIKCMSKDRYCVNGRYILSPNATMIRYKIDSLLYFSLCHALPSNASVQSAISVDEGFAIGLEELEKVLKGMKRHLDYASERTLKMELVEKKGN